jgi:putative SOS response-associated peptidase YedK
MLTSGPPTSNLQPRYNICPTTEIDTIVPALDKRGVVPMRWGFSSKLVEQAPQRNENGYVQCTR